MVGVWLCGAAARRHGVDDHPGIVLDKMVAYWIALNAVPPQWSWWLAAFVLLRLFDIWKPWPIGSLFRLLRGCFGGMADDVSAGAISALLLWVIYLFTA